MLLKFELCCKKYTLTLERNFDFQLNLTQNYLLSEPMNFADKYEVKLSSPDRMLGENYLYSNDHISGMIWPILLKSKYGLSNWFDDS